MSVAVWKYLLFAQYPAMLLLSLYFLFNYLRVRKDSAVKSFLWVLLFGAGLTVSVLFAVLGIHYGYWKAGELFSLQLASWIGVGLIFVALFARMVHGIEKARNRMIMEKELKKAAEEREAAVAQAHEEGRRAAREEQLASPFAEDFTESISPSSGFASHDFDFSDSGSVPAPDTGAQNEPFSPIELTLDPPDREE